VNERRDEWLASDANAGDLPTDFDTLSI